jgi:hypothetical protein
MSARSTREAFVTSIGRAAVLGAALLGSCAPEPGAYPALPDDSPPRESLVGRVKSDFVDAADLFAHASQPVTLAPAGETTYHLTAHRNARRAGSHGWRSASIGVEADVPRTADGTLRIGMENSSRRIEAHRVGARSVPAQLEGNVIVYRDASPGADVFLFTNGGTVEELVLVRERQTALDYTLDLPDGAALHAPSDTLIEARDERGTAWLRMRFDHAWDTAGNAVPVRATLEGRNVRVRVPEEAPLPVLIDPTWEGTADMVSPRQRLTAALLPSGRVLLAGGFVNSTVLASAEVYTPGANEMDPGAFTMVSGSMQDGRIYAAATPLPCGKVLITGGQKVLGGQDIASTDLFDPNGDGGAGSLAPGPSMLSTHSRHSATLLPTGQVLVVNYFTEIFQADDSCSGTFLPGPPSVAGRRAHQAVLLDDGEVLIAGGLLGNQTALSSAEIYQPGDNSPGAFVQCGNMTEPRANFTATRLPDGDVLITGGLHNNVETDGVSTAELFSASSKTFMKLSDMHVPRSYHTATMLDTGWLLIAGGQALTNASHAELFDPITKKFFEAEPLPDTLEPSRFTHTATRLESGDVLLAGGGVLDYAELYVPAALAAPCSLGGECRSGHCVDGVCCDTACDGLCESCIAGGAGTCTPLPEGSASGGDCAADPVSTCGKDGSCDGHGQCRLYLKGTSCGGGFACSGLGAVCPHSCDGDESCDTDSRCDVASHSCIPAFRCDGDHHVVLPGGTQVKDCSPFRCRTAEQDCASRCVSSVECVDGFRCDEARTCVRDAPISTATANCALGPIGADADQAPWLFAALGLARTLARRRGRVGQKR